jgi:hypothetical protein
MGPTVVRVPEESSCIVGVEVVAKCIAFVDGTLGDHRNSVHVGLALEEYPVPVQCRLLSRHCVRDIYDDPITQANLKTSKTFPTL